jgi:CDP-diacylglycerol--serine O-phosphatidyltransferase
MSKVLAMFRGKEPRRRSSRRGVLLLPSMLTVANMFCGWACIVYSMRGDFVTAAPFIGFATVLDLLDGRVARATGSTSEFGVEFDSLADIISFGVAPATLVFAWGLEPLGQLGWAVAFLWLTAAAVRLARFNVQTKVSDKRYFVGMPSPAAAGVPAATVFALPGGFGEPFTIVGALAVMLFPAILMISRIRFKSFDLLIPGRQRSYMTPLVIAAVIAAIVAEPQIVLVVLAYSYLLTGLVGYVVSRGRTVPVPSDTEVAVEAKSSVS